MTDVHAEDIATFKGGQRRLMRVMRPGSYPVITKGGAVECPFAVGDVLLADDAGHVIVMPLDMEQAVAIAEGVVEGHERIGTDSNSLRALAVAILAIHFSGPQTPSSEPAAAAVQAV